MKDKVAIVGFGYVGKAMRNLFDNVIIYDITSEEFWASKDAVNKCDVGIVCVNTPESEDGSADLSQIYQIPFGFVNSFSMLRQTIFK